MVAFAVGALVALAILRLFPALVGLHTCHDAGVVCLFSEKAY